VEASARKAIRWDLCATETQEGQSEESDAAKSHDEQLLTRWSDSATC
jgi:hypothetical protein